MDIYMIIIRLVHILAGVFWIGGVGMLAWFIQPVASAVGPDSQKFMQRLLAGSLPTLLAIAPPLNVLAGLLLYWRDSAGLSLVWITSSTGLVLTLGAILAIVGLFIGFLMGRPAALGLANLGQEIQRGGKPPSQEQLSMIGNFQVRLTQATLWTAMLVSLTLAAMATARYF